MSLQFVGNADAAAASVNLPAFIAGDLAIVFAFRDGSVTAPTLPAGWNDLPANGVGTVGAGATGASHRCGYRELVAGDTTTGTWTNATDIEVIVLRGQRVGTPIDVASQTGAATNQINYPALTTFADQGDSSWALGFAASRTATDVNVPTVTGYTRRTVTNTSMGMHTAEGISGAGSSNYSAVVNAATSWTSQSVCVAAARSTPIVKSVIQNSGSDTAGTTKNTGTLATAPTASALKLALVSTWESIPDNAPDLPTCAGAGLGSWTQVATVIKTVLYRVTLFQAPAGIPTTQAITFTTVTSQAAWAWSILAFEGASGVGTAVTSSTLSGTALTLPAVSALQDYGSILLAAMANDTSTGTPDIAPGPGFNEETERATVAFGDFEVETKTQERVARWTLTTSTANNTNLAIEIKAQPPRPQQFGEPSSATQQAAGW